MTRTEIEESVRQFLVEELEIDQEKIVMDARMKEDIGLDSLDFVDIVVIVDKKFGFKIMPEEMKGIVTLNDFCDYIEKKITK
jgi:acyl carrier protein